MDLAAAMARLRSGPMRAEPTRDGGIILASRFALKDFSRRLPSHTVPESLGPERILRLVILDMDGVLYRGDQPIPGAAEFAKRLHDAGALVRYATNNSMFTRAVYADRLRSMGIAATTDEIVTSTSATIDHLRRHEPSVRSVLAVGAQGMVDELRTAGLAVRHAGEPGDVSELKAVDAVVVGLDPEINAARLDAASAAIRAGARFIATNADARYPTPTGFRPGAGAIVGALADATSVTPLVIGKPAPAMFATTLEGAGVTPAEAVVIGDNPESDVAGAHRSGIESILVLTGVTDADALDELTGELRPDHVAADPAAAWELLAGRLRAAR